MTRFELLTHITGAKEAANIIFGLATREGSPEKLEEALRTELPEEQLRTIRSVAERGDYPLSLDGMQ